MKDLQDLTRFGRFLANGDSKLSALLGRNPTNLNKSNRMDKTI